MATGETVGSADILPAYHAIAETIPVGGLSSAQFQEIREQAGDMAALPPRAQYEYAWVGLEEALAMIHETNPETNKPFTPKEVGRVAERARTEFGTIFKDGEAPLAVRVNAGMALASIGMYQEAVSGKRGQVVSKNHLPYLSGLQKAAGELMAQNEPTEEEIDLMNSMTSLIMLTEYAVETGWFTPASPRQPWQINALNRKDGMPACIVVADEAPAEGIVAIHRDALGNELWNEQEEYRFGATLEMYTRERPGLGLRFFRKQAAKPRFEMLAFAQVFDRHLHYLNEQKRVISPLTIVVGSTALAAEQTPANELIEISWFTAQSASDLRDIAPQSLNIHLQNMEAARERGELAPGQLHTLGWMQADTARMYSDNAQTLRTHAEQQRLQASRISRADAPPYLQQAAEDEEQAAQQLARAAELYDRAHATMQAAAAVPELADGDRFEITLDAEAMPLYKALFTEASGADMTKVVDAYLRHLAALQPRMRDAERKAQKQKKPDQLAAIHAAAIRATFCMLMNGSSEEFERHLAVTHSVRRGGSRGEMDAVVFPYDYNTDGYDRNTQITIAFADGGNITVERRHISIGVELLAPKAQPLFVLAKLASIIRANKGADGKKERRTAELDGLTTRIGDAIADASE